MNPQWHDEFVALCALFSSGELTEEEWALLQVHLAYCDSCRVAFEQYQQIASDVLPMMASGAALEARTEPVANWFSLHAAEKRLMNRLDSASVAPATKEAKPTRWQIYAGVLAACIAVAAVLITLPLRRSKTVSVTTAVPAIRAEDNPKSNTTSGAEVELRSRLETAERRVTELEQQTNAAEERTRQSNSIATNMEQQLEAEKNEGKKVSDEIDTLTQQLAAAQADAQSLRAKSTVANIADSQQAARILVLEAKLREVSAVLDEKDRMLALDKEFLAHDREIRDLIGARDLYIADIYDVAQNGKTSKPFGRIFYTKDKSLVFYGYDLDKQAGLKQSVAFQAWGSGDDKQNVSLGIFYQDETHKRWVLRFNDTKTLARLNMVFVTAEPQGGSTKPTGKPLLLAYLQVQPNHP